VPEIRDLGDLAEYAHRQVAQVQRMPGDLAAEAGEGRSPRGYVHARTGPGGALRDLHIEEPALHLSAHELAAEVTAAITAAQRRYAARADQIMEPVLGVRPSERTPDEPDAGVSRLDALAEDLDRIARRRGLID